MTLLAKLQELSRATSELSSHKQELKEADELQKQAAQLRQNASKIGRLAEQLQALERAGQPTATIPSRQKLHDALVTFREVSTAGGATIRAFKSVVREAEKWSEKASQALDGALDDLTAELERRWKQRASLEELAEVEENEAAVNRAKKRLERLRSKASWRDADPSELGAMIVARAELITELERLDGEGVSPEVLEFLRAARSEGASYLMMTADVVQYLEQVGKLARVRVVLR